MPKVYLTEKDRLCGRLAKYVYGEMRSKRISQETLAKEMGIKQQVLSYKLRSESFRFEDFVFFVKKFQPTNKELIDLIGL